MIWYRIGLGVSYVDHYVWTLVSRPIMAQISTIGAGPVVAEEEENG